MGEIFSLSTTAGQITVVVCGLITVLAVYLVRDANAKVKARQPIDELTRSIPAVLTSLGIFGTFAGIFYGLQEFNVQNIDESVPQLLEGLKTAFVTSLFGMFFGTGTRMWLSRLERHRQADSASSDDPVELLRTIAKNSADTQTALREVGDALVKCFKADDDTSLVSQMKLIRMDITDLKREMTKALNEFGEKVAELGTEALVKSLQVVIEGFNARLGELVGAEFRQLRDAMIKLTEWQQHHRDAIDQMQSALAQHLAMVGESTALMKQSAYSLERAAIHLDSVDGSLATMTVAVEDISKHIEHLKAQNLALATLLAEIQKLGTEAATVMPNLTRQLNEVGAELVNTGKAFKEHSSTAVIEIKGAVEAVGKGLSEVVSGHDEHVKRAIGDLEKGLEDTLSTSLESLGGQLAALSEKFANDYTPLTERLRDVVRLAEQRGQ